MRGNLDEGVSEDRTITGRRVLYAEELLRQKNPAVERESVVG